MKVAPVFPDGVPRRLPRVRRQQLEEVAYLMRREGFSLERIARQIGWRQPASAAYAIDQCRRRLAQQINIYRRPS